MSNVRVFVLLAGMVALFGAVGGLIGGQGGMLVALVIAAVMSFAMYFNSAKVALRAYRAEVVGRDRAPELYDIVDRLRQRAGLPMPTIAIAPHQQPNAFATGRNAEHAVVCATEGLLHLVDREELEGVIAHELGHIKNRDMLLQTVSATMAGAITNLARFGLFTGGGNRRSAFGPLAALLAPLAAMIIQLAIGRSREYKADATGAEISGKPLELANALLKLQAGARQIPMRVSPAMAPLAQVNPLAALGGGGLMAMFSTHPPIESRVARLKAMAHDMGPELTSPRGTPV